MSSKRLYFGILAFDYLAPLSVPTFHGRDVRIKAVVGNAPVVGVGLD